MFSKDDQINICLSFKPNAEGTDICVENAAAIGHGPPINETLPNRYLALTRLREFCLVASLIIKPDDLDDNLLLDLVCLAYCYIVKHSFSIK